MLNQTHYTIMIPTSRPNKELTLTIPCYISEKDLIFLHDQLFEDGGLVPTFWDMLCEEISKKTQVESTERA